MGTCGFTLASFHNAASCCLTLESNFMAATTSIRCSIGTLEGKVARTANEMLGYVGTALSTKSNSNAPDAAFAAMSAVILKSKPYPKAGTYPDSMEDLVVFKAGYLEIVAGWCLAISTLLLEVLTHLGLGEYKLDGVIRERMEVCLELLSELA